MSERVAVVGLGYVGLPVALAFARKFEGTVGFDLSEARVQALRDNRDWTGEVSESNLRESTLVLTSDPADLRGCTFFIVAVPTPLDAGRRPDLGPLLAASRTVGSALAPGAMEPLASALLLNKARDPGEIFLLRRAPDDLQRRGD